LQVEARLLHDGISRASSSLRYRPVDVLLGHFDGATLAVDTVLGINHEILRSLGVSFGVLIHPSGAKSLLGPGVFSDRHLW
jgi:hypothetical protein